MKSYYISLEHVKKSLLLPARRPLLIYLTLSPFILFFAAHPKNAKIFISVWILGHLLMIPSILLGWFIGSRVALKKSQEITDEINIALKKGELIKKVKVLPGNFIFKVGLSNKRDAIDLTSDHKVSVICFHETSESFEAILWKISPISTLIRSQEIYVAIPLEKSSGRIAS